MNEIGYQIGVWFDQNRRELPWRHTKDAYRIWLSEIILQQTRVAQGLDYFTVIIFLPFDENIFVFVFFFWS